MYKWMKEHKKHRNLMLIVGGIEICICIVVFTWYAKINNWYVSTGTLVEAHDFSELYNSCKKAFENIINILSLIITISGVPAGLIIKQMFHITRKIQKDQYRIIEKQRDTYKYCKWELRSFVQFVVEVFEWIVPIYIFKFVVDVMEQIFKLKNQPDVMTLNLILYGCLFIAVIVWSICYIVTKQFLNSIILTLIYCLCILGFIFCALAKNSLELRLIIAILSILLSGMILALLHKINLVKVKAPFWRYFSFITRDIISLALLVNLILFNIPYFYEVTYILYVLILSIRVIWEMLNDEKDLKNIYISFRNKDKDIITQMSIREIGDMVMYTTMDKIDKLVNCKSVKSIRYSRQLSLLEKMQYKKIAGQHLVYADLNGDRVSADKYRIKNDWIYFYNVYNGEIRTNIYHLSDCIALCDTTKLTEVD